jgi:hypothetical protein
MLKLYVYEVFVTDVIIRIELKEKVEYKYIMKMIKMNRTNNNEY